MDPNFFVALIGIIGIDLLLSGDNAMVIALVCRDLPPRQRMLGMWLGTGAAIGLRVAMALVAGWILSIPGLALLGGLYLLFVAVKLTAEASIDGEPEAKGSLLAAVGTIAVADASMSLDNVAAIAALSGGNWHLMVLGILISIPMIIAGAVVINWMLQRAPWLLWLGAVLLGVIGGKVAAEDPFLLQHTAAYISHDVLHWALMVGGGVIVIAVSTVVLMVNRRRTVYI